MTISLKFKSLIQLGLNLLFVLFGLFNNCTANAEGIWSQKGVVPIIEDKKFRTVLAPDGNRRIVGTKLGLQLTESKSQKVEMLPGVAMPPLWEVIWAPNSKSVAINASDGGAVGTWDATIFKLDSNGHVTQFAVSDLVRQASRALPNCDSSEEVNVALVGWEKHGEEAILVAEVPPHSSCKNMGLIVGFRISINSEKIVARFSSVTLRRHWGAMLGPRIAKAD